MTEFPYRVGYCRPPVHSRFQKGRSGNPGGRPTPKKSLKHDFETALADALNADEKTMREAKPEKSIELLAQRIALNALDGRPSAQRLVLSVLELQARDALTLESEREDVPPIFPDDAGHCRELLGDRYDEFKKRFDKAVAAGSADDLLALADEFQLATKFPH